MAYLPIDFELPKREVHHPIVYERIDGRWRGTQVTHLGHCVATGDTLAAVEDALAELVRLQISEECQDTEARELLRETA